MLFFPPLLCGLIEINTDLSQILFLSQLQCERPGGVAAGPRFTGRGRCGHTRAPHPGSAAAAGGEKDRGGCSGDRPDLQCLVQPAGGSVCLLGFCWETNVCAWFHWLLVSYFVWQIVKILTLYTPHSDLDERVTLNFIRSVQVQSAVVRLNMFLMWKIHCIPCSSLSLLS